MSEKATISLGEYLNKTNAFVVPYYQRGYIWGKANGAEDTENTKDAVTCLMNSILNSYDQKKELFLQGITVAQENHKLILIDGQQRTTFFYLLLTYLEEPIQFTMQYEIRKESDIFLKNIKNKSRDDLIKSAVKDLHEKHQDIFFFKKTIRIIYAALKEKKIEGLKGLKAYILTQLKFLYIEIPKEKETLVFSMMNGNKALMTDEELIKAELLRLISEETPQSQTQEWETILLRSKYAREWDRWLYWWNKTEIKQFYKTNSDNTLGLLLRTYYAINKTHNSKYSFITFKNECLNAKEATKIKSAFYNLRCLQKKFEDIYNSIGKNDKSLHNKIGAIITIFSKSDSEKFTAEYFSGNISDEKLGKIYKYVFLNMSYSKIEKYLNKENDSAEINEDSLEDNINNMIKALSHDDVYNNDHKQYAYLQLLRLNIEEDIKLNRAFDFSCWDKNKKSLEHIYPKSKVIRKEGNSYKLGNDKIISGEKYSVLKKDKEYLDRADFEQNGSEHCIGNLVLLHKNENSKFSDKSFKEKKDMYFDTSEEFKSRHLLHSISVFAKTSWGITEIQKNKEKILKEIKSYYDYTK